MTETARLRLPTLAAAQAQKHVTHNEALVYLDTLVQASVIDKDLTAPPGSPEEGDCYIVAGAGGTATGAWISWEKRIARYQDGEWISLLPGQGDGAGWLVWVQDEDAMYRFDGADWGLAGIEGPPGADGADGADGQSFSVDATGVLADRGDYDEEAAGFAFLATDTGDLYIKGTGSGVWSDPIGFQGPQGPAGADGADGSNGSDGADGADGADGLDGLNPGLPWRFDSSTTMADPGAGDMRLNHATLTSVTAIAFSANDGESGNPDVSDFLTAWDDGTTSGDKGVLLVKKWSAPENFAIYRVTAALTDNSTWLQAAVTHLASAGSFTDADRLSVEFLKTGDKGADGSGATAFTQLSDVPASYSGQGSKLVAVNSGGTGLEFVANSKGLHSIWVPAGAMIPRLTNGAAPGRVETATNKVMIDTLDFDTVTQEFAQFAIRMPKSWNAGTVSFVPVWSHAATTTNFGVVWALQGVAISDDDSNEAAFGTEQTSTDTGGTTNDSYQGPASSAITIAGAPVKGDLVVFQIKRNPSDGSDTLAVDARLRGVLVLYTTDAETDA